MKLRLFTNESKKLSPQERKKIKAWLRETEEKLRQLEAAEFEDRRWWRDAA